MFTEKPCKFTERKLTITVENAHDSLLIEVQQNLQNYVLCIFFYKENFDLFFFYPWIFLAHYVALRMHIYILEF